MVIAKARGTAVSFESHTRQEKRRELRLPLISHLRFFKLVQRMFFVLFIGKDKDPAVLLLVLEGVVV